MGVMAPQVVRDRCLAHLRICQTVGVPITQDAEALAPQEVCSADLLFGLAVMLAAIDLDDQLGLVTGEVGNMACDWNLAAELAAIKLALTERSPQRASRVCHLAPQTPCPSNGAVDRMSFHPPFTNGTITPTQPSPIEGEGFKRVGVVNVDRS